MIRARVIPQWIVDLMIPEDRERYALSLGKPSMGWTSAQAVAKSVLKREKEIQRDIANFLKQEKKLFINPPMNKRSTLPSGWPDFTFSVNGRFVGVEVKIPGAVPDPHQLECHKELRLDGNLVFVVTSLEQFRAIFSSLSNKKPDASKNYLYHQETLALQETTTSKAA
jgi:hypothetical protein